MAREFRARRFLGRSGATARAILITEAEPSGPWAAWTAGEEKMGGLALILTGFCGRGDACALMQAYGRGAVSDDNSIVSAVTPPRTSLASPCQPPFSVGCAVAFLKGNVGALPRKALSIPARATVALLGAGRRAGLSISFPIPDGAR